MEELLVDRLVRAPRKIPFGRKETSSLGCPDYSLNCVKFVGLKLQPS